MESALRGTLTIAQAVSIQDKVSIATIYRAIASDELRALYVGNVTLVMRADFEHWLSKKYHYTIQHENHEQKELI